MRNTPILFKTQLFLTVVTLQILFWTASEVFAQTGNCLSFPQPFYSTGDEPCAVASGDFDNDGDNDIVTANLSGDDVTIFLNDGDGRFSESETISVGNGPKDISCTDLNNDGDIDIITCNQFSDDVSVLLGNGDSTFSAPSTFLAGDLCIRLATGDLDGDGFLDVVTANRFGDDIAILLNNGSGGLLSPVLIPAGSFLGGVAVDDMNGDGSNDIIVLDISDGKVFLNDGNAQFPTEISFSAFGSSGITTGDFNNDGNQDVAIASLSNDTVEIFINSGNGTLLPTESYPAGDGASWVAARDLDLDGAIDLIFVNSEQFGEIGVLQNQGDGTFAQTSRTRTRQGPEGLTIQDLDGDGNPDAALVSSNFDTLETFFGNGDGTLDILDNIDILDDGTNEGSVSVAAGDLNEDSLDDIVIVGSNASEVQILLNTGNGSYQLHQLLELGQYPHHAVIFDVDNDGDNDFAVSDRFDDDITIHINDGSGNFQTLNQLFDTGDRPRMTLASDLNGDGLQDLVTPNFGTDNISVLFNLGNGNFSNDVLYPVGEEPASVAAGDIDLDGDNDLVVANSRDDSVSIMVNDGLGVFFETAAIPTGNDPFSIQLADLNDDGDLDIVTSHLTSSVGVSVLFGQNGTGFGSAAEYVTGSIQYNLVLGDFNGDQHLDVATFGNNQVSVLRNDGKGDLSSIDRYRARVEGSTSNWMAVANINGDKQQDLVCVYTDDTYNLYLNACYILGDVNSDRKVDLLDVVPFVSFVTSSEFRASADINCDGVVDLLDVQPFVDLLIGN